MDPSTLHTILQRLYLLKIITRKKKKRKFGAGGVAPVVECLPSTLEALSSNSNTAKIKKKKKTLNFF
jgi:hypothetical protein